MIKWTDIDNEVEEFQSGYRSGFVAIFKKYEGMETDDRDASNRVVKVTRASFSKRYGIAETTFRGWLEVGTTVAATSRGTISDRMAEAAAKAKAEAEAKAAKELAAALERQAKASAAQAKEAMRQERIAADNRQKIEAERIRREEQTKAKEAAAKEIAKLREDLAKAAAKAEFDVSTMTAAQKQQVMTMLANDPDKAAEWFKAQTAERSRKLAEAEKKAKADADKKRSQMADRESRKAAERARQDYDSSALKQFISVTKNAEVMMKLLNEKPVTFDHILASGLSAGEWVKMTELVEDMAVEVREAIFAVNAEQELSEL